MGKRRKRNAGDGHCILYSFLDGLAEKGYSQYSKVNELFPLIETEILDNLDFYGPFVGEVDLVKELDEYFHFPGKQPAVARHRTFLHKPF